MTGLRSAIDWDSVSRARRAQEKLGRYLNLLEQIKELEGDPDLAPLLHGGEGDPAKRDAGEPRPPSARGEAILDLIKEHYALKEFDAGEISTRAQADLAKGLSTLTPKQANDALRRLAEAGQVTLVTPGKRGKSGRMPIYRLATQKGSSVSLLPTDAVSYEDGEE